MLTLRLAILVMLKGVMNNFAAHFGIKCSSFCKVNIGTSMRSACTAMGFTEFASVWSSNMLLERSPLWFLKGIHHKICHMYDRIIYLYIRVRNIQWTRKPFVIHRSFMHTSIILFNYIQLPQDLHSDHLVHSAWRSLDTGATIRIAT